MCAKQTIVFGGLLVLSVATGVLQASTISWGNKNYSYNAWNDARNWVGGVLPTTGDTAVIATGSPSMNTTLSPAPDVIRIDPGATAMATGSISNNLVLNGGKIDMSGDNNPTLSGAILLTADSTIRNTRGNSNRGWNIIGVISENGTPRKLTLSGYPTTSGSLTDNTSIGGVNTYSGGTDVYGATNYVKNLGGLGTGPVNVSAGRLVFSKAGDYTHGSVTVMGGSVIVGATGIINEVWDFQGGTLTYDMSYRALDASNHITIENVVNTAATGGYYNNPFAINTSISGTGKAVLNSNGSTASGDIVQFGAVQQWTGGTDIKGIVSVLTGGQLPAGTTTVYPVTPGTGTGLLRLSTSSSLNIGTDLVLLYDSGNSKYGTISMAADMTVRSLTINGTVIPAGHYTQTDFPNYIVGSGTHTLTVLNPDTPPSAIRDLAAGDAQLKAVTLRWSAPYDAMNPGNSATSYDIRFSPDPITDATFSAATAVPQNPVPQAPGAAETLVVSGLTPATTYYFAIKSIDVGANVSDLSNVVTAGTREPDVTPPAAVTDLQASSVHTRQLTLTWTAPADPDDAAAASYDIRMSTSPIDEGSFDAATVVPQSLTPKTAGQAETLLVSGLTAGTTYYFAIKSADNPVNSASGIANQSTISDVVQQATLPLPASPPAAIADLAAGGSDAFSATLTWTAVADANGTSAVSYQIRYSTSLIDQNTWSTATPVLNVPAPQPGGSPETFAVQALQPSTTYYFAVKVTDEEGNISDLSNVASFTTAPLPPLPVATSITIMEKAGVTTTNYPVTLSMVFAKGDVPGNVIARVDGAALATQTDVKVRWPDGSVRHALISFILPTLQANSQATVDLLSGGSNCNTTWMTKDRLLASDFEANMAITVNGTTTSISARDLLQNMPDVQYWMKGTIASEFIIRDWHTNVAGQLNVSYRVRAYPSLGMFRVSTVVENTWVNARGNLAYDFTLSLGKSDPQVVFAKTGFTQFHDSRWHKVFWKGTTPPKIEIRYDLPYLTKAGAVSNYDTSIIVPPATISNEYNGWNASAHDIMDGARLCKYFPTTGGRPEINPYPKWTSMYLLSMDSRLAEETISYGDLSGSIPMHFREADPNRSFYCHPVKVEDRPTMWSGQMDVGYIVAQFINVADRFTNIGDLTTPWTVDMAHQGSFVYIPYLITGDLYYLEEMQFWAHYDLCDSNWQYRGGNQCWLVDQLRGNAWGLRNLVDAAAMTPPDMPEKAYLESKIVNNINKWNDDCITNGQMLDKYPTVRGFGMGRGIDDTMDPTTCSGAMSSWQNDYMTWSLAHAFQMGYPTLDLLHWLGQGLVDRFGDWPGWNRYRGTEYVYPALGFDASGNSAPFPTWADVNNAFLDKTGPSNFGNAYVGDYNFTSRGAMAMVTNLPNGLANWTWLDSGLAKWKSGLASDPGWAFAPQYKAGDADFDGQVNLADLKLLVASWNTGFGQTCYVSGADLNADFTINLADLKALVANWNE